MRLVLPGDWQHIRLARLLAGGLAGARGCTVDRIEDARIAAQEVCACLLRVGDGRPLSLDFKVRRRTLLITVGMERSGREPDMRHLGTSLRVLDVFAEAHQIVHTNGRAVVTVSVPLELHDAG